jgi:hypothetical protein
VRITSREEREAFYCAVVIVLSTLWAGAITALTVKGLLLL